MEENKELFTADGFRKDSLEHHGVKGQKWGKRRYQNKDGSLTPLGYKHWGIGTGFRDKVSKAVETSKKNRERKSQERDARQAEKITKQAEKARKQLEENARKREIQAIKNQAAEAKRETKQLKQVQRQIKKDEKTAKKEAKDAKKNEKKKEELLKNDNLDEILENKDLFSTNELNNIYMRKMAEKKVADMKPKTFAQKFADKFSVDNIAKAAQKAQKLYNAYDTISTVVNNATGSTILPEFGDTAKKKAMLKKLRTYNIKDIEENLADISTDELTDWNKRALILNRYDPGSMLRSTIDAREREAATKKYEEDMSSLKDTVKESTDKASKIASDYKDKRDARAMAEATRAGEKAIARAEKETKKELKKAAKEERKAADEEAKRIAAEEAVKEKSRTDDYWKKIGDYADEVDSKERAKAEKRSAEEEARRAAETAKEKARTDDYWKKISDYADEVDSKERTKAERRAAEEETKRAAETAKRDAETAKERARVDDYWKRVGDYASEVDAKTKAAAERSMARSTSTRTDDISSSPTTSKGKDIITERFSSSGSKASRYSEAAKIREASEPVSPDYETMEFESALDRTPKKVKVRKVTKKKMDSVENLFKTFSDLPPGDLESESAKMEKAIRESEDFAAAFNAASSASSLSKRDEYYLGLQMVQSMLK